MASARVAELLARFDQLAPDTAPLRFADLITDPRLRMGLEDRRFAQTTPIQSAVFDLVHSGADVVACAETGTGKTAAFLLPLMQRMLAAPRAERRGSARVLVLAPTRELAVQIEDDVQGFAYHTGLLGATVYGGVAMDGQEQALRTGVDIVVATPGRLMDHMRTGVTNFDGIEVLVLDEADRMLDMGFWPDVKHITAQLPPDQPRQTLLFSATMPEEVMGYALEIMRHPKLIQLGSRNAPATTITHKAELLGRHEKTRWLVRYLRRAPGSSLVFVATKRGADKLSRELQAAGVRSTALHADRSQADRLKAVEGFRSGSYKVLVATDIAARGLDIDGIAQVINYEVPFNREAYVHRVGRTGRAEATGTAITLVAPEERSAMNAIAEAFGLILFEDAHAELVEAGEAIDTDVPPLAASGLVPTPDADPIDVPTGVETTGPPDAPAGGGARKRRRRPRKPAAE